MPGLHLGRMPVSLRRPGPWARLASPRVPRCTYSSSPSCSAYVIWYWGPVLTLPGLEFGVFCFLVRACGWGRLLSRLAQHVLRSCAAFCLESILQARVDPSDGMLADEVIRGAAIGAVLTVEGPRPRRRTFCRRLLVPVLLL